MAIRLQACAALHCFSLLILFHFLHLRSNDMNNEILYTCRLMQFDLGTVGFLSDSNSCIVFIYDCSPCSPHLLSCSDYCGGTVAVSAAVAVA